MRLAAVLAIGATIGLGGCAARTEAPVNGIQAADHNDPYEGFNRKMFAFSTSVDRAVLQPVARGYGKIPEPPRKGVRNFVRNLAEPVTLANDILQGKPKFAMGTLSRFVINSTIGLLGFVDVATDFGIIRHREDFGQTLGVWGVPEGPYIFAPILGPLPPRDLVGFLVDLVSNPLVWIGDPVAGHLNTGRYLADGLDTRERALGTVEELEATSIDYYASVRSLYRQSREFQIRDGEVQYDELPDFDEFE